MAFGLRLSCVPPSGGIGRHDVLVTLPERVCGFKSRLEQIKKQFEDDACVSKSDEVGCLISKSDEVGCLSGLKRMS